MKAITVFQRVALIAVLVLPALVYIIFVYGQNEVFFQTLDYVGEKVYDEESGDDCQIHLGYDSGDDIYPNIELSNDVKKKIEEIRKIVWDS